MLFNSNDFLVFFAGFALAYFIAQKSLFLRNLLIVVASYVFYSWWDYRFTGLLLLTSLLDFTLAWYIGNSSIEVKRRALLIGSIVLNLGVLSLFKYFNFFRESFEVLLQECGFTVHWPGWNVVLPVGISFYTFQSMSYVIDVYRRELPASRNLVQFLAYVSFFPQLVAGPIERATNLLPQFNRTLTITAAGVNYGVWLVIWGLFKKVVLADNLAPLVEMVYQPEITSGPMVVLGTLAFGLQIYCDFSGYTDIACGVAQMLGFKLMLNFNLPYASTSLREFWRRWHISLSTWLRDYLYLPLGGNRKGQGRTYMNLGITMLLGGLWHGAALTFVFWGAWHGLGLVLQRWWDELRPAGWRLPTWIAWGATMSFVLYGWLLFRANSVDLAMHLTTALGNLSLPRWWDSYAVSLAVIAAPLVAIQWWQWHCRDLKAPFHAPMWLRAMMQAAMVLAIAAFWKREAPAFIYFQF